MKKNRYTTSLTLLFSIIFIAGCGGGSDNTNTSKAPVTPTLASSYKVDDGRLLASNCYGCHGTNGYSTTRWDSIAGEDELYEEMHEKGGIMGVQTDGFTYEEISKMQNFLTTLSKNSDDD